MLCLREQDKMLDGVQNALHWLSYRKTIVPDEFVDDLLFIVEKVMDVVSSMVALGKTAGPVFSKFLGKTPGDREKRHSRDPPFWIPA